MIKRAFDAVVTHAIIIVARMGRRQGLNAEVAEAANAFVLQHPPSAARANNDHYSPVAVLAARRMGDEAECAADGDLSRLGVVTGYGLFVCYLCVHGLSDFQQGIAPLWLT